jgi:hypothetical protein
MFLGSATSSTPAGHRPTDRGRWATGGSPSGEDSTGEGLGRRLAGELAEREDEATGDGLGDTSDTDGELIDREVRCRRVGRLLETGAQRGDSEPQLHASDVGTDGAAASAEEAAVHLVSDRDDDAYDGDWR